MPKAKIVSFNKVLIANRGEIAVRIIKTLNQLGLQSVAVYTEVDKNSPHIKLADEAVKIGESSLATSYLSIDRIIDIAHQTNSEAIHPGYGFLSENSEFAKQCEEANLIFIGPKHDVIAKMANKKEAKEIAEEAGVPCLPGYNIKKLDKLDEIMHAGEGIGYPIMIKANAGGGGKGMRLVKSKESLENDLSLAKSESLTAFGSNEVILERAMTYSRHIEVQVFGDQTGNLIHLGERDCSIQRRNQKVIEEAPAPAISDTLRNQLYSEAIKLAKAINYTNAGTVEFLVDENEALYFLEMNTRLQVEHAITELITGLDLVEMQLKVADGQALSLNQEEVSFSGHAIEARLYAESPQNQFLPSVGILNVWGFNEQQSIRIDSGVEAGQEISPLYDPMLAKIVAYTSSRKESIVELRDFLSNFSVAGVENNRDFLIDVLKQKDFYKAKITTGFIDKIYPGGFNSPVPTIEDFIAASVYLYETEFNVNQGNLTLIPRQLKNWSNLSNLGKVVEMKCLAEVRKIVISPLNHKTYHVETECKKSEVVFSKDVIHIDGTNFPFVSLSENNGKLFLIKENCSFEFSKINSSEDSISDIQSGTIVSPIHGNVIEIKVKLNDVVRVGDHLAIIEAMKMQHEILATANGKIRNINCKVGSQVSSGEILLEIETDS